MNHWFLFVAITVTLAFAVTGGLARWLGRLDRTDWPTDEYEAVGFPAGGGPCCCGRPDCDGTGPWPVCVMCDRILPADALELDGGVWWCKDSKGCKTYRDTRMGVTS